MKSVEILIGRQVQGDNILVPASYERVSRMHAKVVRNQNGLFIEDLDSSYGTFVNGARIKTKKITEKDTISLGDVDYYILDVKEVLDRMPMSDEEFSAKMHQLKDVYENYQQESNRLQTSGQENMMARRMMPSLVLGLLTTILTVFLNDAGQMTKVVIPIVGGVLAIVVFIFASKWATSSSQDMKKDLQRLNEEFELQYVCPACGASFRGRSWEFIKHLGMCPACKRHFE